MADIPETPNARRSLRAKKEIDYAAFDGDTSESSSGDKSATPTVNNKPLSSTKAEEDSDSEDEGSDGPESEHDGPVFPSFKFKTRRYNRRTRTFEVRERKDRGAPQKHAGKSKKDKSEASKKKQDDDEIDWTPGLESKQAQKKRYELWKKKTEDAVQAIKGGRVPGAKKGKLSATLMLSLPLELLFEEIFGHLDLRDLLNLSSGSEAFDTALASPAGLSLFAKAYAAAELPKLLDGDDMNEKDMAIFLLQKDCQLCEHKGDADVVDFYLRLRICDNCSVKTGKFYNKAEALALDLHPLTLECTPASKNVYPGRDTVSHSRYRKGQLLEVSEELYELEDEEDKAVKKKHKGKKAAAAATKKKKYGPKVLNYVKERKVAAKACLKSRSSLKDAVKSFERAEWKKSKQEKQKTQSEIDAIVKSNQDFVKTRALGLGYSDYVITDSRIRFLPVVLLPNAMTNTDWTAHSSTIVSKLKKAAERERIAMRKLSLVWHYKEVGYLPASEECPFTIRLEPGDYFDLPSVQKFWKDDTNTRTSVSPYDVDNSKIEILADIEALREKLRFNIIAHVLIHTEGRDLPEEWTTTCPPNSKQLLSPTVYDHEWASHFMRKPTCGDVCCGASSKIKFAKAADKISTVHNIGDWRHYYPTAHFDASTLKARGMVVELAGLDTSARKDPAPKLEAMGKAFQVTDGPDVHSSYYSAGNKPRLMNWKALITYLCGRRRGWSNGKWRSWTLDEIKVKVLKSPLSS